jgi:hypothetical protein
MSKTVYLEANNRVCEDASRNHLYHQAFEVVAEKKPFPWQHFSPESGGSLFINARNLQGEGILDSAVMGGSIINVMAILAESEIDTSLRDIRSHTALHRAAKLALARPADYLAITKCVAQQSSKDILEEVKAYIKQERTVKSRITGAYAVLKKVLNEQINMASSAYAERTPSSLGHSISAAGPVSPVDAIFSRGEDGHQEDVVSPSSMLERRIRSSGAVAGPMRQSFMLAEQKREGGKGQGVSQRE